MRIDYNSDYCIGCRAVDTAESDTGFVRKAVGTADSVVRKAVGTADSVVRRAVSTADSAVRRAAADFDRRVDFQR